jgi:hypothetical protein
MNRFTAGLMVMAGAAALAVLAGSASASVSTRWSAEATPSPPGAESADFSGIACGSSVSCTAVGGYYGKAGHLLNLAEHYNGSTWAIQRTPDSGSYDSLSGVACISAADCIAVGFGGDGSRPLIESWNGAAWAIDAIPPGGGSLYVIKCAGASSCIAVGSGSGSKPLIEHYNGTSWARQAVPSGVQGYLDGVACVTASDCYASGDYDNGGDRALLLHWNGTAWAAQASPALPKVEGTAASDVNLSSVACHGTDCTAAGGAYYWEGTPEASVTTTLAERWNGSAWSIEKTVNPPGDSAGNDILYAVRCPSATSCTAAGEYGADADGSPALPLIETWNGSTWSQAAVPDPSHGNGSAFSALACPTTYCTAVGSQDNNYESPVPERPLAEHN